MKCRHEPEKGVPQEAPSSDSYHIDSITSTRLVESTMLFGWIDMLTNRYVAGHRVPTAT